MMRLSSRQQLAHGFDTENSTRAAHKFRFPVHNENARRMTLNPEIRSFGRLDNHAIIRRAHKIRRDKVMTLHHAGRLFVLCHVSLSMLTH
jgi:hypothetical protein